MMVALLYLVVNASLSKFARVLQARNGRLFAGRRTKAATEVPPSLATDHGAAA
jgi:glutamate transport system permease protein